ncbi:JmjC domain-containing protein [Actinoplanes sp. URMC 104]|uniref:JmjC domain-containing protein n=1 Tax=Actinoplanes sp. URMC 104 TaxID=3423409 RepID=UPI003F193456
MSLRTLFDDKTVADMMTSWPTQPAIHDLPAGSCLPGIVNAPLLNAYLESGTAPVDNIILIKGGAALHPRAYTTAGDLDPGKITKWRGRGYTVQLRNLNRWQPALHTVCAAIQQQTGYGCYATGFITPAGAQGLGCHWDQNMGFIYQIAGRKSWQIWEPVVDQPHRDHLACNTAPCSSLLNRLKTTLPDEEFDLQPGQVLVLPRGYAHNVHARAQQHDSVHLTFVVRERTGFWIGEKLTAAATASTEFRRAIPPAHLADRGAFAEHVDQARKNLIDWLAQADEQALAAHLIDAARTERDVDYL